MEEKQNIKENGLKGSWIWGAILFFVLILVDQLTKAVADVYFKEISNVREIVIIPDMIELCISYNRGIAFSMFATSSIGVKMAIVLSTGVMMAGVAYFYFKIDKRRTWIRVACILILAGGIGNLIDRVYYQVWDPASYNGGFRDGVRDMVRLKIIFDFGVCNFADFFICGGAATLFLSALFFDSYAYFPLGKYKALAKEAEEKDEIKEEEFKAKRQAKKLAKQGVEKDAGSVAVIGESDEEKTDEKAE
ncbi:MAG: signal peptidase II [Clostridiales bacterium]|nr:signal peptidase II [Clostridiales bacterium]